MTETPHQATEPTREIPGAGDRVDSDHLRDYSAYRRSTTDRKLAGVAGGLGRHLNIDPTIVRVVLVVLVFFGGAGLILYGAAWLLVPEDDGSPSLLRIDDRARNTLLLIVAVVAALAIVGDSWGGLDFPWPLALLALAVFWVLARRESRPQTPPAAPPGSSPAGDGTAHQPETMQGWQPVVPTTVASRPRRKGPLLFGITVALVAVGLGVLGIIDANSSAAISDGAYPAVALAIIGVMLVVGAFYGRAGGLPLLGAFALVALPVATIGQPSYDGSRDVQEAPTSAAQVQSSYEVPAGRIELDLSKVQDLSALDGRTIDLSANAGEIRVILPRDANVTVDSQITWGGAIDMPGKSVDGFGADLTRTFSTTTKDAPTIDIDIDLDFGHVDVTQAA